LSARLRIAAPAPLRNKQTELLPAAVFHDKCGFNIFDRPGRREAALIIHGNNFLIGNTAASSQKRTPSQGTRLGLLEVFCSNLGF
jgi:hypothetical protein